MATTLLTALRRNVRPLATGTAEFLRSVPVRCLHFDHTIGVTDEQQQYQNLANEFGAAQLWPHVQQWNASHTFPREALQASAELGFAGLYVRSDVGGTELSRQDARVIFEALARYDVSTTAYLTIHNMVSKMIDQFGSDSQRQYYLPAMVKFNKFASYCLTEPGNGSDAGNLQTRAVLSGDKRHYILNGTKAFISGGGMSDVYLVMARTGEHGSGPSGVTSFLVEKGTAGLSFGAQEKKMGWHTQPTCNVIFEDCHVPVENVLGGLGNGFKIAMTGLDGGRISIATLSTGAAIQCLNLSIDYVKQRKQFGAPLSKLQSIQFKLADMTIKLHSARGMIQRAAEMLDTQHPDATVYCAMAKKYATDAGFEICNQALQLHGGYGYIADYHIERHVRDVRVNQILEGTNEIMQLIVSRHMLKD